jgi:hypothetical protein
MKYWILYIAIFIIGFLLSSSVVYGILYLFGFKSFTVSIIIVTMLTAYTFGKNYGDDSETEES